MNCAQCALGIEPEGKKMQMPCCDSVYHPQCGIDLLCNAGYWTNLLCACGSVLHAAQAYSSSNSSDIDAGNMLLDTEEVKPHFKNLKKKLKEVAQAQKEFDTYLKEEFTAFEESVVEQLEAIKTLKETRVNLIKGSTQFKRLNSAKLSFSFMFAKFQKKYPTIPTACLRHKMGSKMLWRLRYNSAICLLKRKFRLRKWY